MLILILAAALAGITVAAKRLSRARVSLAELTAERD